MSRPIIEVQGLGKKYQLGVVSATTLAEDMKRLWTRLARRAEPEARGEFWALRDVSFAIAPGEVVGIIGRNGAGKSTLLKILSRITEPTAGRAVLRGRVASLLEVGTGFHGDLTGRENVFLNGAILGLKRAEVAARFDGIVAFAEVERFIDTPVKHYSSGMYVRLAFAVAAHLEPDILVVDEVLAVGDSKFQEKCLGKIKSIAGQEGRTVIFVSHNLLTVQRLCQRALLMQAGQLVAAGNTEEVLDRYVASGVARVAQDAEGFYAIPAETQTGNHEVRFRRVRLLDQKGAPLAIARIGQSLALEVEFETHAPLRALVVGLAVHGVDHEPLFATHWNDHGQAHDLPAGRWRTRCNLHPNYLRSGHYTISLGALTEHHLCAHVAEAFQLRVEPVLAGEIQHYDERIGKLFIPMRWESPTRLPS